MKSLVVAAAAAVALAAAASADDADKRGAQVGKWTQDHEAAVKLAEEKNLPLFLKFTGSDWCGWCMLMEEKVFSDKAFKRWASTNIVLVSLDFPRGKNVKTVPDAFKERNKKLASEYGVGGFPTYFVLSPSGARLGRMGASRDATAEKFLEDLREILSTGMERLAAARLSPAEREEMARLRAAPEAAEKAKAALEEAKQAAIAAGRAKMAAAKNEEEKKAAHDEALAAFRAVEEANRKALEDIEKKAAADAARLAELEAKLR